MLRAIKHLIEAAKAGRTSKAEGNHSFQCRNGIWYFRYHWSNICVADPKRHLVAYDNHGFNTNSTTRAINSYKEEFGWYREVNIQVIEHKEELQEEENGRVNQDT